MNDNTKDSTWFYKATKWVDNKLIMLYIMLIGYMYDKIVKELHKTNK